MSHSYRLPIVGDPPPHLQPPTLAEAAPGTGHDPRPGSDADEKLLQVGDLARETGKTVRAIHHYETVGLLSPHKRSKGRYRLYGEDAVARVRWIDKLHDLGMSLSEIQQILELWERAPSAPSAMGQIRTVYRSKLADVRSQLARLQSLERELGASLEYLDTCEVCDPGEIVTACSSCTVHGPSEPQPELVRGLHAAPPPA